MLAQTVLPRWRGFNLLEMLTAESDGHFVRDHFRWIADWGFDFVRLPLCYLLWMKGRDTYRVRERMLERIDNAVRWGQEHGLHVCLNLHRAPGYSVHPERTEPYSLWKDDRALEGFCYQWEMLARRYKGTPSSQLSFNLVNEPPAPAARVMTRVDHERVIRAAVTVIHRVDPQRLIIVDGVSWGNEPCPELASLRVAQSCRAYLPMGLSHYRASWVGGEGWPEPTWPGALNGSEPWDRNRLEQHYARWATLAAQGVGVHCGEAGAFHHTPHAIVLRWLRDVLEILKGYGIGYALRNLCGPFGVLDSGRRDVAYEDWHGHRLDRQMLELLQAF